MTFSWRAWKQSFPGSHGRAEFHKTPPNTLKPTYLYSPGLRASIGIACKFARYLVVEKRGNKDFGNLDLPCHLHQVPLRITIANSTPAANTLAQKAVHLLIKRSRQFPCLVCSFRNVRLEVAEEVAGIPRFNNGIDEGRARHLRTQRTD